MSIPVVLLVLKASVMLLVLGIGLTATPRDATYLVRHPRLFARTIFSMNVAMPLLAALLCLTFSLHPAIVTALVALSISPVPPFLSNKAGKAGGHGSYAKGVLVTTSLLSVVIVPASLWLLDGRFGLPLQIPIEKVAKVVAMTVLLPIAIGIGVAHFVPAAARAGKVLSTVATIVLVAAAVPLVVTAWPAFLELFQDGTLTAIIALTVVGLVVGHLLGGPDREHRAVLALATAARHPAVAIVIATTDFPGNRMIIAGVLLALLVSGAASAPYVAWNRRLARRQLGAQPPSQPADLGQAAGSLRFGHSRNREP